MEADSLSDNVERLEYYSWQDRADCLERRAAASTIALMVLALIAAVS
jgi:hypothetical protein